MARTLAESQELFIAISNSYSFPGMHCVTSKESVGADDEIEINRSINTALCVFPLLTNDRCLPLLDSCHEFSSWLECAYNVVIIRCGHKSAATKPEREG